MQFRYYNEVNLYDYKLSEPNFDSINNIFMSKFIDVKDKELKVKSGNMRLVSKQDKSVTAEFLYTTNDYYQFIKNLDKHIKSEAEKHLINMLGSVKKDTFDNLFKSSVTIPDQIPALPTMTFKINDACKFTGLKRRKISFDDFKENTNIEIHYIIHGINYLKNKCEVVYDVIHLKLIDAECDTLETLLNKKQEEDIEYNLVGDSDENE